MEFEYENETNMEKVTTIELPSFDQQKYDEYWKFINERQNIWYKRFILKNKSPYTNDNILNNYKFTNVCRRMDRNSLYVTENIINKKNVSDKDILFNIFVFRIFNRIETYEKLSFTLVNEFDVKKWYPILKELHNNGNSIFTSAYMTNARLRSDVHTVYEKYLPTINDIHKDINIIYCIVKNGTPEEFMDKITSYLGFGDFLAYEMYCDIANSKFAIWDENDFVNVGPGAFKGLSYIYPNIKRNQCYEKLRELHNSYKNEFKRLGLDFKYYDKKELTLRDIEHSMCEFQKYIRVKYDGWRPRVRFNQTSPNTLYDEMKL